MSYEEFTARKWTVVSAGLAAKHTTGNIVTFAGSENEVSIQCKRYEDGMYEEDKNQIVVGDYIITLTVGTSGNPRIEFAPKSESQDSIGGSWTAEDMSNQSGDDE
jgi:hypothetical protein